MKLRWSYIILFSTILGLFSNQNFAEASTPSKKQTSPDSPIETSSSDTSLSYPSTKGFDPVVRFGNAETAILKVEMYHSLNCIHCKEYLQNDFPIIKEKFIDSGQVYFEIRDYPIDRSALDAARLAWCRNDPKVYWKVAELLHTHLDNEDPMSTWAQSSDWCGELIKILQSQGFTSQECQECLDNQTLRDKIINDCYQVQQKYKLAYTPAFVVDGELVGATLDVPELEKRLKKKLQNSKKDS